MTPARAQHGNFRTTGGARYLRKLRFLGIHQDQATNKTLGYLRDLRRLRVLLMWDAQIDHYSMPVILAHLSAGPTIISLRDKAPYVVGRSLELEARVRLEDDRDGVIVAQGGSSHGYTVYVKDGKPAGPPKGRLEYTHQSPRNSLLGLPGGLRGRQYGASQALTHVTHVADRHASR